MAAMAAMGWICRVCLAADRVAAVGEVLLLLVVVAALVLLQTLMNCRGGEPSA